MAPPTAETCAVCTRTVERRLDANDAAHREIGELLADVRAAQVAAEVHQAGEFATLREDLAHVAGRRNGRGWWRTPLLSAGLGLATVVLGWGAIALIGHGERLAALEAPTAQAAQVTSAAAPPPKDKR